MTLGKAPYCGELMPTEFGTGHKCGKNVEHTDDHRCICDRTWPKNNKEN